MNRLNQIIRGWIWLTFIACLYFGCLDGPTEPDNPSTPNLVSPANNATISTDRVTLIWVKLPDLVQYEIVVSRNSDFSNPEVDTLLTDTSVSTTLTPGRYFWRVRGQNSTGLSGEWSETGIFRLGILDRKSVV